MSTAGAGGTASDATVSNNPPDLGTYRSALADDAEAGVKAVRDQIKHLQASLKIREAEAKRLRAEAKEGTP